MLKRTLLKLWQCDGGSVLSTEYMLLGSVAALGSVTGLVAMRDATVNEMKEMGSTVREIRQHYMPKLPHSRRQSTNSQQQAPRHYQYESVTP